MSNPLVSVIVPAYNHGSYVKEAIESVLQQDYPSIELLVLNDGSTDNTWDILNTLKPTCEKHFARFLLSTQKNAGPSAVLSRLIEQSKGEYILVLASDDKLLPGCITEQVHLMQQHSEIVQTLPDNYFIGPDGTRLERKWNMADAYVPFPSDPKNYPTFAAFWKAKMPWHDFYAAGFHDYTTLLKEHMFLNGSMWRASAIKSFQLPSCRLSEDYFINLQLAKLGRVAFVDQPLFAYRIHSKQTICNRELLRINEQNLVVEEIKRVSLPGQEHWQELLKKEWFSFHSSRKGPSWCYLERRNSYICSQRFLVLLGHPFILHTRYKFKIPAWCKDISKPWIYEPTHPN